MSASGRHGASRIALAIVLACIADRCASAHLLGGPGGPMVSALGPALELRTALLLIGLAGLAARSGRAAARVMVAVYAAGLGIGLAAALAWSGQAFAPAVRGNSLAAIAWHDGLAAAAGSLVYLQVPYLALAVLFGALLAWGLPLSRPASALAGGSAGILIGSAQLPHTGAPGTMALQAILGLAGALALVALPAAAIGWLWRAGPQPFAAIAFRVAGSWLAAIAAMGLALFLAA